MAALRACNEDNCAVKRRLDTIIMAISIIIYWEEGYKRMEQLHGGDLTTYRENYPSTPILDFSANLNPYGLPEGIRRALAECADDCIHYPDPQCRALRSALAEFEQTPAEWILCGNGAADLIYRIAYALRPQEALIPAPTFVEYERALSAAGCTAKYHQLAESGGFALDASILPHIGPGIVFLCNPNNPTGLLADPGLLDAVLARCEQTGAVLVVDECFLDFIDSPDAHTCKRHLQSAGNLIILKAFTKLFAIPGLRLGYLLCGNPELLARIEGAGPPWSVSVPAQQCGVAATAESAYLAKTRCGLPAMRRQLFEGLARLGFSVLPGQANFLFFRAQPGLVEALHPLGILLRDCSSMRGLGPGWYRTAVRTPEENAALLSALVYYSVNK